MCISVCFSLYSMCMCCMIKQSAYFSVVCVSLSMHLHQVWCVLHCVCMRVSAQMEPLIEACAADHYRTHYGNFQLEEPASIRAGRVAGWVQPPQICPSVTDRHSNCTAVTIPIQRRRPEYEGTAVFILHSSQGTWFHSPKPIFDYRSPFPDLTKINLLFGKRKRRYSADWMASLVGIPSNT